MSHDNATPFARYRKGYEDGYFGREKAQPDDKNYLLGYEEGHDDDATGKNPKFLDWADTAE